MGDMTRAEMDAELVIALENRDDNTGSSTRRQLWLEWSYRHISMPNVYRHRMLQGSQTITLVTSTATYTLATDLWATHHVFNATRCTPIRPRSQRQIDSIRTDEGEPHLYSIWGNSGTPQVHFRNVPSSNFNGDSVTLRYWERPARWASAAAVTVLDPEWDEAIIMWATWRGWKYLDVPDRAEIAKQEAAQYTNEIHDPFQTEGEDTGWEIDVEMQDAMPL